MEILIDQASHSKLELQRILSEFLVFIQSCIASLNAALMLTLSVNEPLDFVFLDPLLPQSAVPTLLLETPLTFSFSIIFYLYKI